MGYYGYYDGLNFFGPLFMILIWALIIWGIFVLVRTFAHHDGHKYRTDKAAEILRERFARGDISKEEFETKRKSLDENK